MAAYILRRCFYVVPIVLGVTLLTFVLFHIFGGNPTYHLLGRQATLEDVRILEHQLGLDRPFWQQYFYYLYQIITCDFGRSLTTNEPVSAMIARGIGPTLSLTLPALVLSTGISVALSLFVAIMRGKAVDRIIVVAAVLGMSISFLAYIILGQYFLSFKAGIFPIHDYEGGILVRWQYLALPILTQVVVSLGYDVRFFRSVMIEEVHKDYIRTAFAKGLSRRRVLSKHLLKNAMIPIITRVMVALPFLLTGSLLLEKFFGIPGMGSMLVDAFANSDIIVIKAYTVYLSLLYLLGNVLTDILYSLVDPSIRFE
ncbi:MAG: ABC transporter permease [Planctomycetota bacterium]